MRKKPQNLKESSLYSQISVLVSLTFFMAACGGGTIPSSSPPKGSPLSIEKKKTGPVKVEVPKEGEKNVEKQYAYDSTGKTDPFKPFIQITSAKRAQKNAFLTPLEKYEISQLKLVAIISTPEGNVALIEDSTGKGYFLKKGTGIGKNDGKVKRILKDKVVIEEIYEDVLGRTKTNEISLYLHRVEEGGES